MSKLGGWSRHTGERIVRSPKEGTVKFLILIQSNSASLEVWERLSDDQRVEFGRAHLALTDELADSGELVVSEGLADPGLAKHVSVREGRTMTSDGPFAEAKEHLAGFYLVECESIDQAVEVAARVPDAAFGSIEVRPVLDFSAMEL